MRELKIDVAILSEQYKNIEDSCGWLTDISGKAAIWICGKLFIQETPQIQQQGFTWVKVQDLYIFSVYAPPSESQNESENMLVRLVRELQGRQPAILAGDFNAWATEWGSRETNSRSIALLDALAFLNVALLNTGTTPTFETTDGRMSIIDLTFATECIVPNIVGWHVSDDVTRSDHRAILFEIGSLNPPSVHRPRPRRWNTRSFNREVFDIWMDKELTLTGSPEDKATQLMSHVAKACDASMTRCGKGNHHRPVYWWNNDIDGLRHECHRARRLAQRSRGRPNHELLKQQHKEACRALNRAIKVSERSGW